jgi:hypothetical protein
MAQWEQDGADYQRLARGFRNYYHPKNFPAELAVEELAVDHVRLNRVTRQEQLLFTSKYPFDGPMMDRIVRSRNSIERAIYRHHRELERLQENGQVAFGKPGTDRPGDSGSNDGPCPSPAVGPQGGVNTGGEAAPPDGSEDCPESGADLWVESEEVIFQRPPEFPAPDSNDRESKGGSTSQLQSGKSNPIIDFWISAKTKGPTEGENNPPNLLGRLVDEVLGCPYPYDVPQVAPRKSGKTKPISTIVRPAVSTNK